MRPFFRKGEKQRIASVRKWIAEADYQSVIDIGCGDGYFLSEVLDKKVKLLRMEDINANNILIAEERFAARAERVETVIADSFLAFDDREYDIVMAIGLFDYYRDWRLILDKLMERTHDTLIVDFPKSFTFHALIRKIWLFINKVSLFTITEKRLNDLVIETGLDCEIKGVSSNWMVKIKKRRGDSAN